MNEPGLEPRRRLTRAEAKARTRQRLLDSAARIFAEKGFGGATLEEIAESAGYSTGAMYANFGNKDQLFMEVVAAHRSRAAARWIGEVTQIFDEALAGGTDPFDALTGIFVKAADRDRELAPLQAEFWLYAVRNPAAKKVIADSLSGQVAELEPVVARALQRFGALPDAAPHEVTVVVLALFQGLARRRRLDPATVPDDLLARALRWLFAGLRSEHRADGPPGHSGSADAEQMTVQAGDEPG
jgi:AcrR family transcriptional regulator